MDFRNLGQELINPQSGKNSLLSSRRYLVAELTHFKSPLNPMYRYSNNGRESQRSLVPHIEVAIKSGLAALNISYIDEVNLEPILNATTQEKSNITPMEVDVTVIQDKLIRTL